ncbi:MAG: ABC transporter ATP-binding protein [Burkholderiales bacterium]|nr:ABC transporter ATP-binding protein [Burkholderiales bacterium]
MVHPVLKVVGLEKKIDSGLVILRNISFEINPGDAVSIVGASGSGKSTLLGLMAGLDHPSSGKVYIGEQDLYALSEDERARLRAKLVGFVFQSFQLLPALTALENVMLPLELAGRRGAKSLALDLLGRVGLAERTSHYPRELSGGEQQRVAIARAFVTDPAILFADEPTGNLDSATGESVIELMFELNREQNATLILVTHDAELARRCGKSIHLKMGEMVE